MSKKTKVIFVGSNPAEASPDPSIPFAGTRSGKTLQEWMQAIGVDAATMVNVSAAKTEKNRKLRVSEYELERLRSELHWGIDYYSHATVIALGETAADALRRLDVSFFKLPHPSGRNRKLNDKEYVSRVLEECRQFVSGRDETRGIHGLGLGGRRPI